VWEMGDLTLILCALSLSAPDFAVNVAKVADSYFTDGKDQAFIGALGMGFGKLGGRAASSAGYGSGSSSLIDFTYPFIFDSAAKDLEER